MNVYKFRFFYNVTDEESQERYVVAESEESAWEKIEAHFEQQNREGFMKPAYILDPIVEIEYVII